jgi:hypothetical protein
MVGVEFKNRVVVEDENHCSISKCKKLKSYKCALNNSHLCYDKDYSILRTDFCKKLFKTKEKS